MANLDLLDLLNDDEKNQLSDKLKQKALNEEKRKAQRVGRLQDMGLFDDTPTVMEWVPQETVTFWRVWQCRCGSTYEGPAYDGNPTYVRMEKMRIRHFSVHQRKWVDLAKPRSIKGQPSVYKHANYQLGLPHRVETEECQLWSCRKCKATVMTVPSLVRPWRDPTKSLCFAIDEKEGAQPRKAKKVIPTSGEVEGLKTGSTAMTEALEDMGFGLDEFEQ